MIEEYDHITAYHYAAYRPSLHLVILKNCLVTDDKLLLGLDVGCGTGQSCIALSEFCENVIGIEPSKEMLSKSINHPNVTYRYYNKTDFNFADNYFDLITFAGSLYYAKSQRLLDEVIRVSKNQTKVIVYDFELLIDVFIEKMKITKGKGQDITYNHEENFDGLNNKNVNLDKQLNSKLTITISINNIAHLLLSSKENYKLLQGKFGGQRLHNKVIQELYALYNSYELTVDANTFATIYTVVK